MRFLALVFVNLHRHKLRALIGVAGISFGVAAMLTILSIVNGAIGMFERILAVDSHCLVFERNVSDLFFSSVTTDQIAELRQMELVESAQPLLFGLVSTPGHPIVTCFGVEADNSPARQGQMARRAAGGFRENRRWHLVGRAGGGFSQGGTWREDHDWRR